MKLESLRAKVSRWGWGRTLFAGFMSCLRTYARDSHLSGQLAALGSLIALSLLSDDYFLERGYTAEVGFSEISNFPGIAAADFIGRRRVGFAGYVKWFGRAVPFRTAGVKRIGFELFEPQPSDDRLFLYRRV